MKKVFFLLVWIMTASGFIQAQSSTGDRYVINPSGDDGNLAQVESRYKAHPNSIFLADKTGNPLTLIADKLANTPCLNLHLYIAASFESLTFNNLIVTTQNINEFSSQLNRWTGKVTGKIMIHSLTLAESGIRPEVVMNLESLTGIPVEIVRYY